jgi:hypothetical protein
MALPPSTVFNHWEQYLSAEDFEYLIQYIDNINYGIPNDKMIILLGPGRNGKTTLMDEIESYLGDELCGCEYYTTSEFSELIFQENIKPLIMLDYMTICWTRKNYKRNLKLANLIKNFTKYGISFITDVNRIDIINQKILKNSRIIEMTHIFTD